MDKIIKSIEIQLGKVNAKITPDEAAKLHQALGDLLGIKEKVVRAIPYQTYPYYQPYWIYPDYTIKCDNYTLRYTTDTNVCTVKL